MNILFVKPSEAIGTMYVNSFLPKEGEEVCLDGETFIATKYIKHFPDAGKGIKEYANFRKVYPSFTRVLLSKK